MFSCFLNVSTDSIHESEWNVDQPGDPFDTTSNGYAVSAVMILYLLIGLPWNSVVIGIIVKKRLFYQPALMLMLNLAATNFLVYTFVMPYNITTGIAGEYVFGTSDRVRCRVCQTGIAIILFPLVSTHTLTLMAVDRFIYLKKPMHYKFIVTPRRMLVAIASVWGLSTALSLPPLFGFGQIRFSHTVATCVVFFDRATHVAPNFYYILVLLVEGTVPFVVLCVMYVWIICITRKYLVGNLRRTLSTIDGNAPRGRSGILKEHSRSQVLLVYVFGAIFTSNIITWLPLVPLVIAVVVLEPGGVPTVAFSLAYLVYMSSTVIHPILQACLTHEIRETIKDFLAGLCRKK